MKTSSLGAIRELLGLLKPYRPTVIVSVLLGMAGGLAVTALLATVNQRLHAVSGMHQGLIMAFAGLCVLALASSMAADCGTNFVSQRVIARLRRAIADAIPLFQRSLFHTVSKASVTLPWHPPMGGHAPRPIRNYQNH